MKIKCLSSRRKKYRKIYDIPRRLSQTLKDLKSRRIMLKKLLDWKRKTGRGEKTPEGSRGKELSKKLMEGK